MRPPLCRALLLNAQQLIMLLVFVLNTFSTYSVCLQACCPPQVATYPFTYTL